MMLNAKNIEKALEDINNIDGVLGDLQMREGIFFAIKNCLNIDNRDINTTGSWAGDFQVKFDRLILCSLRQEDHIVRFEIRYSDTQEELELVFVPNVESTISRINEKRGQFKENLDAQRRFLELISSIVYMRDNKIRGYAWLPKFEEDVRELLDEYEIIPIGINH